MTFRSTAMAMLVAATSLTVLGSSGAVIVLVGGTLIDGTGRPPLRDAVIVIEDGRIREVFRQSTAAPVPPGAITISAEGKFVIPGLADAHVHYAGWMPELYLHYGVTTALVPNRGESAWLQAQRSGMWKSKIPGPRLLLFGTGGGATPPEFPIGTDRPVTSEEQARALVRAAASRQVDGIKIHVAIGEDLLRAFVDEASKEELPVLGHLGKVDAREAALAGISGIAHMSGIATAMMTSADLATAASWRSVYARFQVMDPRYFRGPDPRHVMLFALRRKELQAQLIKTLVNRNVYVDCDLVHVARGATERRDAYLLEDYRLLSDPQLDYIPQEFRIKQQLDDSMFERLTEEETKRLRLGYRNMQEFIREFVRAGGRILAGTDAGSVASMPGVSMHRNLELLVDAGLEPLEALTAATRNVAAFAGRGWEARIGTLEPGKLADLIVLDANPLAAISNTRTIRLVMQEGRVVERSFHAGFRNPLLDPRALSKDARANPEPAVRSIHPALVTQGDVGFRLRVRGAHFVETSLVRLDGDALPTDFVSENELLAQVATERTTEAATRLVTVYTPQGGGESTPTALIIQFK